MATNPAIKQTLPSAGDRYLTMMESIQSAPVSNTDIFAEAQRLSSLFPQQRNANFFDLATALSRGLTAQARSGQPASVGQGLAMGFNAFSEGVAKRQEAKENFLKELQMMAYQSVEKKRAEQLALRKEAGTMDFKIALERAKQGEGGIFSGLNSIEGRALNFMTRYKEDPTLKDREPAAYANALMVLSRPEYTQVLTDLGIQIVPLPPKYDVEKLQVPAGYTDTGKVVTGEGPNKGKKIYDTHRPDGKGGTIKVVL
jgi:hypothetical protein